MIHSATHDKNLCGLWAFLHPLENYKIKCTEENKAI